jgi:hypothetical protein|tara:strand:+ start:352 stop:900 length:549 start_codon:yes stop_codon:yes gene_type:complete
MSAGGMTASPNEPPSLPEGILEELTSRLTRDEAPFLRYLAKELSLQWADSSDNRLGYTRFEYDHHELFRRRRLRGSPGPITIALHPRLKDDEKLYLHTLVHELLHAAGLVDHGNRHQELVHQIAPAPKLSESVVLRSMREEVLAGLPEQSWICGECGHTWERRRVSLPQRCPKCARPFSVRK